MLEFLASVLFWGSALLLLALTLFFKRFFLPAFVFSGY